MGRFISNRVFERGSLVLVQWRLAGALEHLHPAGPHYRCAFLRLGKSPIALFLPIAIVRTVKGMINQSITALNI
jgi:hypothetical protein